MAVFKSGHRYVIMTHQNRFLSAQGDGRLETNREAGLGWELFTVNVSGGKVTFRGDHGLYMCVVGQDVMCNATKPFEFNLIEKDAHAFSLQNPKTQKYVCIDRTPVCNRDADLGWETLMAFKE